MTEFALCMFMFVVQGKGKLFTSTSLMLCYFVFCRNFCAPRCACTVPPPPLHLYCNRATNQGVGGGGGEGTVIFHFANLLRRLGIELLLYVCWLDKVVLLHCIAV